MGPGDGPAGAVAGCRLRRAHAYRRCHTSSHQTRLRSAPQGFVMAARAALCRPRRPLRASRATRRRTRTGYVVNGDHAKKRSARQRMPVDAESEPLELRSHASDRPSAVRPALALTAAEEVETIRRVLLEAATSTSRQSWATCTCPECGKGFRQEISVPDHGARIKAVETLLREGLGRVGEAEVAEPRMPTTVAEVKR